MPNGVLIAVLPIGEMDAEPAKKESAAIVTLLKRLGAELVIADPVSDENHARQSVQELSERNPDLVVIVPLRGLSAQAIEAAVRTSRVPCLLYPIQGSFALPSSLLARGALRESNIPVELHYMPADHPGSLEKLRTFTNAAGALSKIRKSRIGIIGNLFPNLVSCRYDPQKVSDRLGTSLIPIPFQDIRNSVKSLSGDRTQIEKAQQDILTSYRIEAAGRKAFRAGVQLHLALKQVAREQRLDGFATECWSGFPQELGLNPCLGFLEDAYTIACEGDVMLCISLLMVRYLTGTSPFVGDLYDLDLEGALTLTHCGGPASLALDKRDVVLARSPLALERGFETLTCRPLLTPGPVTLFRFYGGECDQLHLAQGDLLSSEQAPNLIAKVKLKGSRFDFLEQCFGNHYVVVAGDIRQELRLFGKWLDIAVAET
jgi:L-fucose isomerase-like protein